MHPYGSRKDARKGRKFCGRPDRHPYELFLQLEGIEHRKTKVPRPQSSGIVERFPRTMLDEHFRVEGRRTWFETVEHSSLSRQLSQERELRSAVCPKFTRPAAPANA